MKKLIILIAIVNSIGFCEVDYIKVFNFLENCSVSTETTETPANSITFLCDSGFVKFDFDEYEIYLSYNVKSKDNKKRKMVLLFNRGWNKKDEQIHKEKSVIGVLQDEFEIIIGTGGHKWNGKFYDFYEKFKENVYYGKKAIKNELTDIKKNDKTYKTYETNKSNSDYVPDGGWYCDTHKCE